MAPRHPLRAALLHCAGKPGDGLREGHYQWNWQAMTNWANTTRALDLVLSARG